MDKKTPLLPPELAQALDAYYTKPDPNPAFAARLASKLRQRQKEVFQPETKTRFSWFKQRRPIMQTLRGSRALVILLILISLFTIAGVVYAIGTLSGFIPGFGFVSETTRVSQIETPVVVTQNGYTLTVEKALNDEEHFFVTFTISPNPGSDAHCFPEISLPDGQVLFYNDTYGDFGSAEIAQENVFFSPLPPGVDRLELRLRCPAVSIDASFPLELHPVQAQAVVPADESNKAQPLTATNQGITMLLKNVALSPEKTVFQVMLYTDQPGDPQEDLLPMDHSVRIHFLDHDWAVQLQDQNGQEYPVKDITPEQELIAYSYRLKTFEARSFNGDESLILRLVPSSADGLPVLVGVSEADDFVFDPGATPSVGQTWELDQTLQAGNFSLQLKRASMTSPSELIFEFAPIENVRCIGVDSSLEGEISSFDSSSPASQNNLVGNITFVEFPQHPITVSISLICYTIQGPWEINWSPKAQP